MTSANREHYADFSALPDAESLYQHLLQQIRSAFPEPGKLAIVGIHSGGAWLAQRLAADLQVANVGFVDVSFYRDDYAERGLHAGVKPSQIGFAVDAAHILLVDDVLYTGRTTRAALNELFDYGRPARIQLAALVDRGGRELPICADFVAASVKLATEQALVLRREANGQLSLSLDTHHA